MKNLALSIVISIISVYFLIGQGLVVEQEDSQGNFGVFGKSGSPLSINSNLNIGSNKIQTLKSGILTFPTTYPSFNLNPLGGNIAIGSGNNLGKFTINHNSSNSSPSLLLSSNGLGSFNTSILQFENTGVNRNYQIEYSMLSQDTAVLFSLFYYPADNNSRRLLHHWPSLKEVRLNQPQNNDSSITYTGELRVGVQNGGQPFNMYHGLNLESISNIWRLTFGSQISFIYNNVWVATIDGDGEYFSFSDAKFKTDIQLIQNALLKILEIEPKTYNFKNSNKNVNSIGFVAQDLLSEIPEAVDYNSDNDLYAIGYRSIGVLLVRAIQERQEIIEALKNNLEEQKRQYDYLVAQITFLENE